MSRTPGVYLVSSLSLALGLEQTDSSLGGIRFELRDTPTVSSHSLSLHDLPPTSYIILKVHEYPQVCSYRVLIDWSSQCHFH